MISIRLYSRRMVEAQGVSQLVHHILKVMVEKVRFPDVCPVCLQPANEVTTVIISDKTYLEASPYRGLLVGGIGGQSRYRYQHYTPGGGEKRVIRVPTCELHKHQEVRGEFKTCWFAFALISFAPILLLFYGVTNAIFHGGEVFLDIFGLLLLLGALLASTLFIFWPRPFQRAFAVMDVTPNDMDIILKLKNHKYSDLLVSMNEMYVSVIGERELLEMRKRR